MKITDISEIAKRIKFRYPMDRRSPEVRFFKYLNVQEEDQCWEWIGCVDAGGYGRIGLGKKLHSAHRISWMLHRGLIPVNINVLHKCDNRKCCNPKHLFLGTQADNMRDMTSKKRNFVKFGCENPRSKLNRQQVREIREYKSPIPYALLMIRYGVSYSTLRNVIHKRSYCA